MKYFSLTLLIIICSMQLKATGDAAEVNKPKRLYGGFVFTPGVSHRYMHLNYIPEDEDEATMKRVFREFNKIEHPDFGFEMGGVFGVRLTRFMAIETGVKYMMHRYTSKTSWSNYSGGSYIPVTDSGDYRAVFVHNSHYINIPIGLNFEIGKGRIKGIISPGVNVNLLAARTETFKYYINGKLTRHETEPEMDLEKHAIYNFSPYLSAGVDYSITELMSLRITATWQMQVLKNTDTPFVRYLYFAGINMGLLFHFDPIKKKGKA